MRAPRLPSGPASATERRGLIALALILVTAVAAIALWRGNLLPGAVPATASPEMVRSVESAARADSLAREPTTDPPQRRERQRQKPRPRTTAPAGATYDSPLDHPVPPARRQSTETTQTERP